MSNLRFLGVLAVLTVGCKRLAADEPALPAVSTTASAKSCDALGQRVCESAPVGCDTTQQLFTDAELTEGDCAHGLEQLAAIESLGPELRPTALHFVLVDVLRRSKKLTREQLAALESTASGTAVEVDYDAWLADVQCPGIASKKGDPPPAGDEVWCETADGQRHGPAVKWNAKGELVLRMVYRRGALTDANFLLSETNEIPIDWFVCSEGETRREEKRDALDVRSCTTPDGTKTLEMAWKDGKVVSVESLDSMGSHVSEYMNVPE